jgi:LysM repeat protein
MGGGRAFRFLTFWRLTLVIAPRKTAHLLTTLPTHFGRNGDASTLRTSSRSGSGSDVDGHYRKFGPRAIALAVTLVFVASCAPSTTNPPEPANVSAPPMTAAPPVGGEPKAAARSGQTITVKSGQSLGGIAEAHHVSKRAIIAANRLHPPYDLKVGARLIIPASEAVASAKGDEPHRSHGLAQSAPPAKASEPPEVIPLD